MASIYPNNSGNLSIAFTFRMPDGTKIRAREGTGLKDNLVNRANVEKRARLIQAEIDNGIFDYTRHFPFGNLVLKGKIKSPEKKNEIVEDLNLPPSKRIISRYVKEKRKLECFLGSLSNLSLIGEGANGLVYKADWKKRKVAVKFFASKEKNNLSRFKDEILLQNSINGLSVAPVIFFSNQDIWDGKILYYYVMEYCSENLRQIIKRGALKEIREINKFFISCLESLKKLHDRWILHRDLKPENIFIKGKCVYLGDLGIAQIPFNLIERNSKTYKGERLGNRTYCAPEQLKKIPAGKYTDIFSLGLIFFEILTGNVPKGLNPKLPSKINKNYEVYDEILLKMSQDDPKERFQDAEDIIKLLRPISEKIEKEDGKKFSAVYEYYMNQARNN